MPGDPLERLLHPIKLEADLNDLSQNDSTNGDDLHAESMLQEDSECHIPQFDQGHELQMINHLGNGIEMLSPTPLSPNMAFLLENNEDVDHESNILMQHMDIREPLSTLKSLLERRLGVQLDGYQFWLQDAQILEAHKNLVDQCVQGKGLVQVNVQIRTISKRINIVDVLKPHDEYVENQDGGMGEDSINGEETGEDNSNNDEEIEVGDGDPLPGDQTNVIKWVVDGQFKKDQTRLRIPDDPAAWTSAHVKHWLQWAVRQFHLANVKLNDWNIPGQSLCDMTHREFQQKVPADPGNVFWTHVELLRKCKFVAVLQKDATETEQLLAIIRKPHKNIMKPKLPLKILGHNNQEFVASAGNRSGNNGQIQLWQFLLDILTDKTYKHAIQWIGSEGEFKLNNPEYVARLWGSKKNKPTMNYEKLSRALRYYYDGDMISKVHGKRFVYKFVCDLKQVLGYDAGELSKLVSQCSSSTNNTDFVWRNL